MEGLPHAEGEPARDPRIRLRLDLAYDGTAFSGWARQPGLRTVQGELEIALATVLAKHGPPPTLTVAGRTDVGVHALGQVAHLDLTPAQLSSLDRPHRGGPAPKSFGPAALARRLNGIAGLQSDVVVTHATLAPPGFDARFSALWRRYEYRIADPAALRDPRRRGHTLWHPADLDVEAMDAAARSLLGLHDFAAFCRPRPGATTIRTLQDFGWMRDAHGVLVATVRADAFCHSMVRALVGACVAVGEAKLPTTRPAGIRDEAVRGSEFIVLPAKGLTLVEVGYPDDDEMAARAALTRARRFDHDAGID
ncbi:tRNA pseudouridine synthase A [Lysinimonas soli]|uniref:tRNA pseudouridine synthase A n=1 Tax=Lysinimonas soli TaxID=1074233 RepID=A0ABW0NS93_9MICO